MLIEMYFWKTFTHLTVIQVIFGVILSVNILGTQIMKIITNRVKDTNKLYANIFLRNTSVRHQILCLQSLYLQRCA